MPPEKATFGARDPSPAGAKAAADEKEKYSGPERRSEMRRSGRDRRADVRFDFNGDRRQLLGRRGDDASVSFW
tara:strand:+ start:192098 stop:192316 length:219 start_codon:yes stop_codon:yes gene_type:complete